MALPKPISDEFLQQLARDARTHFGRGRVARYIPALAEVRPDQFGLAICYRDGRLQTAGDAHTGFSSQSISKVLALVMAMRSTDVRKLWQRVRQEPSGMAFASLVQLESENGIPRNPFVNAGALVVVDILCDAQFLVLHRMREFARALCDDPTIGYDVRVARSELDNTARNAAIGWLLKSFGNLNGRVERVLEVYCHFCALHMSCAQLARCCNFLCNGGVNATTGERLLTREQARRVNGLMLTCGLYDASGTYAAQVGLPSKSGVGGGLLAVLPGEFTVCAWSPALDSLGNSIVASWALERLVEHIGRSPLG
ncbi:L-glutaminase [Microbulbifer donghaiensis]|uniref:Glutaminase n=1 Tax=Microbulbifer donghaiensis TaxID=494016 RepID=A0A1M5E190_9GAMM|nr:glutaminase [Microbulbifer donghaiensis]SHF73003.1 L-glutaminase [Microbulbifer donghaiensis]